jgi:hypothetical protein
MAQVSALGKSVPLYWNPTRISQNQPCFWKKKFFSNLLLTAEYVRSVLDTSVSQWWVWVWVVAAEVWLPIESWRASRRTVVGRYAHCLRFLSLFLALSLSRSKVVVNVVKLDTEINAVSARSKEVDEYLECSSISKVQPVVCLRNISLLLWLWLRSLSGRWVWAKRDRGTWCNMSAGASVEHLLSVKHVSKHNTSSLLKSIGNNPGCKQYDRFVNNNRLVLHSKLESRTPAKCVGHMDVKFDFITCSTWYLT